MNTEYREITLGNGKLDFAPGKFLKSMRFVLQEYRRAGCIEVSCL
jgi:hypothetical protein